MLSPIESTAAYFAKEQREVRRIKEHVNEFAVDSMCCFMEVSRSAYYAWLHRVQTSRERDDIEARDNYPGRFQEEPCHLWHPACAIFLVISGINVSVLAISNNTRINLATTLQYVKHSNLARSAATTFTVTDTAKIAFI